MAVGVSFVVKPFGICAKIGEINKTDFSAVKSEDWYNALNKLLSDPSLRKSMGENG